MFPLRDFSNNAVLKVLVIKSKLKGLNNYYIQVTMANPFLQDTAEFALNFQQETPIKKGKYSLQDRQLQDRVIAQVQRNAQDVLLLLSTASHSDVSRVAPFLMIFSLLY